MPDDNQPDPAESNPNHAQAPAKKTLPLPGMAGIALYMLAISAVVAFGVVRHQIPPTFLIVSLLTGCAAFGLLRQQRWGWALSLAATFLLMIYQFYLVLRLHEAPRGFMAVLNLILFLYLVRPEVTERLR